MKRIRLSAWSQRNGNAKNGTGDTASAAAIKNVRMVL